MLTAIRTSHPKPDQPPCVVYSYSGSPKIPSHYLTLGLATMIKNPPLQYTKIFGTGGAEPSNRT